jgi:putative endonuclease
MNKARDFQKRSAAEKRGRRAETIAALWLQFKGYRILERRYKTKLGEIDLIARRGKILAIVEVKQRKDLVSAYESLHPQALKRIERAAARFLNDRSALHTCDVRYDALFVLPGLRVKHLKDAWRSY